MLYKFAFPFLTSVLLIACKPYQMDIPQGKQLSPEAIAEIHVGMTKGLVLTDLGTPLQGISPYDENRLDYVYTMQKNGGEIHEERLSIYFKDGLVNKIVQQDNIIQPKE